MRFPAIDPPAYVDSTADPPLARRFRETIEHTPERAALVARLSTDDRLALYAGLLRARLHDIQLKRWVRTGIISKAWLGTGEEATTVGPVHALERGTDIVAPMIRNAAACCEFGLSLADMLRAYLGSDDSPSRGRDLHVGSFPHGVLQPISQVGDMVPVISGIALTFKMKGERRVALTWVGAGSTSTMSPRASGTGPRATASGAPGLTATTCWTRGPRRASRPSAAARGRGPQCSSPRRSAWAGTRRTTSARRARRSPTRCSRPGANGTPSASMRSG